MASVTTTFDPKSLVIANIMNAGETINYDWSIDEMYQIILTKGTVIFNGNSHEAISVIDIPAGSELAIEATIDSSFLTLLRSDNQSVVNQIMPPDGSYNYYDFMQSYRPDWYGEGVPPIPPATIVTGVGDILVTSDELKSMVLDGWA